MQDHIIRATIPGVRAFAAVTTQLVEEARRRHECYPVCSAALGRTMTAALLLAENLKTDESITVRISGDGPIKEIVADAQNQCVRGYLRNPYIDLPLNNGKLDVGKAVGKGFIYVTRFTNLKEPFTGSAPLISGEIAEDVTNYLYISEQTPSSIGLGVLVDTDLSIKQAGGFFIQPLPDVEEYVLTRLEKNLASLPSVTQMLLSEPSAVKMLEKVFEGFEINVYEEKPVSFKCRCSRERVKAMLISLGKNEIEEMINEGQAEIKCHFCGDKYIFNAEELKKLLLR